MIERLDRYAALCLAMGLHSTNSIEKQYFGIKDKAITQLDLDKIQKAKLKRQAKNQKRLASK